MNQEVFKSFLKRPLFYLILFFLVFFYRQIFLGEVFYCCDNLLINIPAKVFLVSELKQGRFPLWNPYILSGTPFLADLNLALFSPLNILYFLFPPFKAPTWSILVSVLVGMLGMYKLGKTWFKSSWAAALSATIFAFSGTLVVYTNNLPMLQVASLIPWLIAAWTKFFAKPDLKNYLYFVALAALQTVSGHPQFTYYTWLLLILYLVFIPQISPREKLKYLFFILVMVFLLTAVQVLPFWELSRLSTRIGRGFAYASFDSLSPFSVVRFLVPTIVGILNRGTAWIQGGSLYGYVGAITLILGLSGSRKVKLVRFFQAIAIVSLLLAFGSYTPLYRLLYEPLPGLGNFRGPGHFLLLFSFSLALLAGFTIDELSLNKRPGRRLVRLFIFSSLAFFASAVITLMGKFQLWNVLWLAQVLGPEKLENKLKMLTSGSLEIILTQVFVNLLIAGLGFILAAIVIRRFSNKALPSLFILVFLELFLFARANLLTIRGLELNSWLRGARQTAQLLAQVNEGSERILVDPQLYPAPRKKIFGLFNDAEESSWQLTILRPNINMLFNLPTIDGYAPLIYLPYQKFFQAGEADPTGIDFGGLGNPKLTLLGAKYVLGTSQVPLDTSYQLPSSDGQKFLYQHPAAIPRFFALENGVAINQEIEVQEYWPNTVSLKTSFNSEKQLVFVDTNCPGWLVNIDGSQVPLIPYTTFKSVMVPAGVHQVLFRFLPKTYVLGLGLSFLGGGLYATLVMVAIKGKKS